MSATAGWPGSWGWLPRRPSSRAGSDKAPGSAHDWGMSPETRGRWWRHFHGLYRHLPSKLRKVLVTLVGGSLVALGAAMIVLPGPAFLVIPAGLAVLSLEYAWAHRLVDRARRLARRMRNRRRLREPPDPGLRHVARRGFGFP